MMKRFILVISMVFCIIISTYAADDILGNWEIYDSIDIIGNGDSIAEITFIEDGAYKYFDLYTGEQINGFWIIGDDGALQMENFYGVEVYEVGVTDNGVIFMDPLFVTDPYGAKKEVPDAPNLYLSKF